MSNAIINEQNSTDCHPACDDDNHTLHHRSAGLNMGFDYATFFREEEDSVDELLEQQYQDFFEVIRINLIIVLLVSALCFIANLIISKYKNADLNNEVSTAQFNPLP